MTTAATAHSRYNINYHLVWCPKYRHQVLKGQIEEYFRRLLDNKILVITQREDLHYCHIKDRPNKISCGKTVEMAVCQFLIDCGDTI